ncbi:DUF4266 domain-containing protein [Ideonella sp. DXS29W]|uniref:DUF4266 domain-containing protein n=1 Tax=Ideonella lacteola TaxID=2984193 RepID=A0ABU9BRW1_9BURK
MNLSTLSFNRQRVSRAAGLCAVAAFGALLQGCSPVQPWVQAYERERLADPIMQMARDTLAERHRDHVFTVREGARGATGVQGGGCGCN